ncbi:MAG TPA: hypothetical protein VK249_13905 [Anaerolineales bacterium]|nr:hypothetical protein [Anaerolineales bacterium]
MNTKTLAILLIGFVLLAGCAMPAAQATPTQATPTLAIVTSTFVTTATPFSLTLTPGAITPLPGETASVPPGTSSICADPQVTALIESFKTAILTSSGTLLSSTISPTRHMDVAFFRNGTVLTYDPVQAKFLFETTYEADWGAEPGSGAEKIGSFHAVVVPELVKIFNQPYTLTCNEIKHGGASYDISWPYKGEFYSVYFPGTQANGNMDWRTWVIGIEYVSGKPYIYALMQFFWEP